MSVPPPFSVMLPTASAPVNVPVLASEITDPTTCTPPCPYTLFCWQPEQLVMVSAPNVAFLEPSTTVVPPTLKLAAFTYPVVE